MTQQELERAADRARLVIECSRLTAPALTDVVPGGVQVMCNTPGVFDSFPIHTPHLQFMAGLDSTAHVLFIAITEPAPRGATSQWVTDLMRHWGQPAPRLVPLQPKERINWVREPYVAQVDTTAGGRAVSLGLARVITAITLGELFRPKRPLDARRDSNTPAAPPISGDTFIPASVDEGPRFISGPPVVYPESLQRAGITGRVVVQCVLDTTGHVEPASVTIVASPDPAFNQPARDFVMRAAFTPARLHGRPVRTLIRIPVDFNITRSK